MAPYKRKTLYVTATSYLFNLNRTDYRPNVDHSNENPGGCRVGRSGSEGWLDLKSRMQANSEVIRMAVQRDMAHMRAEETILILKSDALRNFL